MSNIPSEDDFTRADRLDHERERALDIVQERILRRFAPTCPLVNFHIMSQRDVDFRAYIFFKTDEDIAICGQSGVTRAIEEYVLEQLEVLGRGAKTEIRVAFEVDSHENVVTNFDGDYWLRLR